MLDFFKIKFFNKKQGFITCVCGESGTGKSTYVKKHMSHNDIVLDGDGVRYYINDDLGFSLEDRKINNIRIAKIAIYLANQGFNVWISTVRADIAYSYIKEETNNVKLINLNNDGKESKTSKERN